MKPKTWPRRRLLTTLSGAAAALGTPAIWSPGRASQQLVVADAGGNVTEIATRYYYRPFQLATGIEVVPVGRRGSPVSDIKVQVDTRNHTWDVCSGISSDVEALLEQDGYLEAHGVSGPDFDAIPADLRNAYYVPEAIQAFALAYRTDANARPLTSYADMWDPAVQGVRSLRRTARDTIEGALRADGVKGGPDVYAALASAGGWDRAFRKLDQIKPVIRTWWSAPADSARLLQTGEVDILPTYTNRTQSLVDAGLPFATCWEGGFYQPSGWVIPRGVAKADLARRFIEFTLQPARQGGACQESGVGPANPLALDTIEPGRRKVLTTYPDNFRQMARLSDSFWAKNLEPAQQRFNEWLLT